VAGRAREATMATETAAMRRRGRWRRKRAIGVDEIPPPVVALYSRIGLGIRSGELLRWQVGQWSGRLLDSRFWWWRGDGPPVGDVSLQRDWLRSLSLKWALSYGNLTDTAMV
jgi:hypothetical protein